MDTNDDIDQLILHYLSGSLDREEKARLDRWLQLSPANQALLTKLTNHQQLSQQLERFRLYPDDQGWSTVRRQLAKDARKVIIKKYWPYAAVAASVTALLISYWLINPTAEKNTISDSPPQKLFATQASKSKVLLPDGSVVILNKGSKIHYNAEFGKHSRAITLEGEAYFDIVENKAVPLVVSAGPLRIKELGTIFNVKAYPGDSVIETTLVRGSIEVRSTEDSTQKILMHPNEKLSFNNATAGNAAETVNPSLNHPNAKLKLEAVTLNATDRGIDEILWVQDKLVFDHERFSSLAKKMEHWYGVEFVFLDSSAEQLYLTGSLEKENLADALEALSKVTAFEYSIDNNKVSIRKK